MSERDRHTEIAGGRRIPPAETHETVRPPGEAADAAAPFIRPHSPPPPRRALFFSAIFNAPRSSRAWSVAAVFCLTAAGACWWSEQTDAAFVAATLGIICWFIDLRNRLRESHIETGDGESSDDDDDAE